MAELIQIATEPNWYRLRSGYNDELRNFLVNLPGARYGADGKGIWRVPFDTLDIVSRELTRLRIFHRPISLPPRPLALSVEQAPGAYVWQRESVPRMILRPFVLCHPMGAGKTREVIMAWELAGRPPILIVGPAISRGVWKDEFAKWTGQDLVTVITDGKKSMKRVGLTPVTVISYDLLRKLPKGIQFAIIVYDEAHKLQSRDSGRTRAAKALRADLIWELSGTFLPNRVENMWAPVDVMYPDLFGSLSKFKLRYCGGTLTELEQVDRRVVLTKTISEFDTYEEAVSAMNLAELRERFNHFADIRTQEEVEKDLPPFSVRVVRIPPPAGAVGMELARAERFYAGAGTREAWETFLERGTEVKLAPAVEWVESAVTDSGWIAVLTYRKAMAKAIATAVPEGIPVYVATGEMDPTQRYKLIKTAEAESQSVPTGILIATIDSITESIAATFIRRILTAELPWEPWKLAQVYKRFHRKGQTRPVSAEVLVMENEHDEGRVTALLAKLSEIAEVTGVSGAAAGVRDALNDEAGDEAVMSRLAGKLA